MPLADIGLAAALTRRRYAERMRGRCRASTRQVFPKRSLYQRREGRSDLLLAGVGRERLFQIAADCDGCSSHRDIVAPNGESGEYYEAFLAVEAVVCFF